MKFLSKANVVALLGAVTPIVFHSLGTDKEPTGLPLNTSGSVMTLWIAGPRAHGVYDARWIRVMPLAHIVINVNSHKSTRSLGERSPEYTSCSV